MNTAERFAARHEKAEAEGAAWPDRYPVVARMLALGFAPWAYGNTDWISRDTTIEEQLDPNRIMYRPPTQFGYAAGGLLYPDHAQGPAHGAIFSIYSHARVEYDGPGNLDDVAKQPVWQLYDRREWQARWMGYAESHLTLDQAARLLIARAAHHRQHYLVIEWVKAPHRFRRLPELTVAEWRELATVEADPPKESAQPATQQQGLFGVEPKARPLLTGQREIAAMIAGHADDERIASPDLVGLQLEYLMRQANKARHPNVPPVPTLDEVMV